MCVRACVRVCDVCARVRARVCVRVCVCACVRACDPATSTVRLSRPEFGCCTAEESCLATKVKFFA